MRRRDPWVAGRDENPAWLAPEASRTDGGQPGRIVLHPFILAYGYKENIEKLIRWYRAKDSPYKNWVFPLNSSVGQVTGEQPNDTRRGTASPRKPKSQ